VTRLKEQRLLKRMPLREAARRANTDPGYFWRIENGQSTPGLDTLLRIAGALGIDDLIETLDFWLGVPDGD
jgi:transcriptional regulator with XRE-family HTH domain